MAKFYTSGSLVFNAITFGSGGSCMGSVDVSQDADNAQIACAGGSVKENVVGQEAITLTMNVWINTNDTAMLNAIQTGTNSTIAFDPAGTATGTLSYASTSATVLSLSTSFPVDGVASATVVFGLDDWTLTGNA